MSRFISLPIVLSALVLIPGCHRGATLGQRCLQELDELPVVNSVTIDVEQLVDGIVEKLGVEPYWDDIPTIRTACQAPALLPDQLVVPAASSSGHAPKPVQRMSVPGLSGVVFVYLSQGEEEVVTGLAAAFVGYRADGKPAYAYKASEVLRDEGWGRVTSSAVGAASVQRCSQEIEHFRYAENGDVIGELGSSVRTPRFCEQLALLSPDK
jgi:hypothetical protein